MIEVGGKRWEEKKEREPLAPYVEKEYRYDKSPLSALINAENEDGLSVGNVSVFSIAKPFICYLLSICSFSYIRFWGDLRGGFKTVMDHHFQKGCHNLAFLT